MFPANARDTKKLGLELIQHLRSFRENTKGRSEWSLRNFEGLREFAAQQHAKSFPCPPEENAGQRTPQFLWDYIAHCPEGILIAAESEFDGWKGGLCHDFEKLLNVRSPLKVMMTRIRCEEDANKQAQELCIYADTCCTKYSAGEVFILYCVWWAEGGGPNRDIAFLMQIPGKLDYVGRGGSSFEVVPPQQCGM